MGSRKKQRFYLTKQIYFSINTLKHRDCTIQFDTDSQPIILDTGASATISYNKTDFITLHEHKGEITGLVY